MQEYLVYTRDCGDGREWKWKENGGEALDEKQVGTFRGFINIFESSLSSTVRGEEVGEGFLSGKREVFFWTCFNISREHKGEEEKVNKKYFPLLS